MKCICACRLDPGCGSVVPTASLGTVADTAVYKLLHGQLYQRMAAAYADSKPLADRYKTLVQGYAVCNSKKGHTLCHILHTLGHEEVSLECFQV